MDINERSKEYAAGKALSAINAAIEQAYIDGYNDGLKHLENERLEAFKDGVEYKDLGLKSGTLWSSRYVRNNNGLIQRIPFMVASQLHIPTLEEYRELCNECNISYLLQTNCRGYKFTGINGESIVIEYTNPEGGEWREGNPIEFRFWLNENGEKDNEKKAASMRIYEKAKTPLFYDMFMGFKLPVMLVKNKQQ